MKELDDFMSAAADAGVQLQVDVNALEATRTAMTDALFHLPLLALCIVVVAGDRRRTPTSQVTALSAGVLCQHFAGLRRATRRLDWSVALRTRCADALAFLEVAGLGRAVGREERIFELTPAGREFLRGALSDSGSIGPLARGLLRAHQHVKQTGLKLL